MEFFLLWKKWNLKSRVRVFFGPTCHALTIFHMGSYKSSSRQCFNLYWRVTTSIVLICCSYMSERAFWVWHKLYSKISKTTRSLVRLPCPIPFDQHEACRVYDKILATLRWYLSIWIQRSKTLGDLLCGRDIFAIKVDDSTQNFFSQLGCRLQENVQEIIYVSFTMAGSHVKGSK
jgi:hypothetical protein